MKEFQEQRTGPTRKEGGLGHSSAIEPARLSSFHGSLCVAQRLRPASGLDRLSSSVLKISIPLEVDSLLQLQLYKREENQP